VNGPKDTKALVPDHAVAEAMRARRGWHTGVRVNTDVPEAEAIRADLQAALPALEKHFEEHLKELERQREEALQQRDAVVVARTEAEGRAEEAQAALADRDRQVRAEVERLREIQGDCERSARNSGASPDVRNIAATRAANSKVTADNLEAILTQPSSNPPQQQDVSVSSEESQKLTEIGVGIQVSVERGEPFAGTVEDDAKFLYKLGGRFNRANPPQQDREDGDFRKALTWIAQHYGPAKRAGEVARAALAGQPLPFTQPEADPEVPRCGGSGRVLVQGSAWETWGGSLGEGGFPTKWIDCPGCPDCQPTPELLGEEGLKKLLVKKAALQLQIRDAAERGSIAEALADGRRVAYEEAASLIDPGPGNSGGVEEAAEELAKRLVLNRFGTPWKDVSEGQRGRWLAEARGHLGAILPLLEEGR
jgi:hypothetical protein